MWTCNRLDLQRLGSQPVMPKNLPDHCYKTDFTIPRVHPNSLTRPMIRENRQLVTNQPVQFQKSPVEVQTAGKLPIVLEEVIECTQINLINENRRMWACNQLDLQILGSQPVVMPKNLPDHKCGLQWGSVYIWGQELILFMSVQWDFGPYWVRFTPWTMKLDHGRWFFSWFDLMVWFLWSNFLGNQFSKPLELLLGVNDILRSKRNDHAPKSACTFIYIYMPQKILMKKLKFNHSLVFSCLHLLFLQILL